MGRNYLILLVFIITSAINVQAQNAVIDSFQQLINTEKTDSGKSAQFLALANNFLNSDLKKSLNAGQKCLEYAEKASNETLKLKALNVIGNCYQRRSVNDSAMMSYELALDIAKEYDLVEGYAIVYNNIAIIYTYTGKYEEAIDYYLKALEAEEEMGNLEGVAQAYNNIGVVHYQTGDLEKTTDYLGKAAQILEELGDEMTLKKTFINIGAILSHQKKYEEAIAQFEKGLIISKKLNDIKDISICLSNMADAYVEQKAYAKAEEMMTESLRLKEEYGYIQGIFYDYENFAQLYLNKGDVALAKEYYEKAIDFAKKHRFLAELRGGYMEYGKALNAIGEYKEAYQMLARSYLYKDSLINETSAEAIAELETKYETAKKEQTILEQENEIANAEIEILRRSRLLYATGAFAVIILLLGLFIMQRNKRRAQAEKDAAIITEREEGIKAIFEATENERKRIASDLHDGIGQQLSGLRLAFSNLAHNIGLKVPEEQEKVEKLAEVLDETCTEVRSISHEMMPKSLAENGLVSAIDDMLSKTLRYTNIAFEFEHHNVENRFAENVELSLYRVCQELINNVVKHSEATLVSVQLYKMQKQLILLVEDNGKGISEENKGKEGIGLKNMNSRITSIDGEISFEPSPNAGMVATIRVPII